MHVKDGAREDAKKRVLRMWPHNLLFAILGVWVVHEYNHFEYMMCHA
jgi:hypothetical protein